MIKRKVKGRITGPQNYNHCITYNNNPTVTIIVACVSTLCTNNHLIRPWVT